MAHEARKSASVTAHKNASQHGDALWQITSSATARTLSFTFQDHGSWLQIAELRLTCNSWNQTARYNTLEAYRKTCPLCTQWTARIETLELCASVLHSQYRTARVPKRVLMSSMRLSSRLKGCFGMPLHWQVRHLLWKTPGHDTL